MMPPRAPLARVVQDLRAPFAGPVRRLTPSRSAGWRFAVFAPAIGTTLALIAVFLDWFRPGGLGAVEVILTLLIGLTFFWIAQSVSLASAGLVALLRPSPAPPAKGPALRVALLMPIYHEDPAAVFGNALAMLEDLAAEPQRNCHRFDLFVLSDTRDPAAVQSEEAAYAALCALAPRGFGLHYRHRPRNSDRKTGNIADWVEGWGAGWPAMLVLDADSLMTGAAILALTDALASDPDAGLVQSFPTVHGAHSLWGRVQQFAGAAYGPVLAEGLAAWTGTEGNFWGHNAILRTRAFAQSAGLPHLPGRRGGLILSHDFVEAALMRRAGWAVRFLPRLPGSHEEAPQTLVDYVLRDRRWCQGNLQHLRLLGMPGVPLAARFHMLQGAFAYLMSPAWFVLLLFWAVLGNGADSLVVYFDAANPFFPIWPEASRVNGWLVLGFMYAMLVLPKVLGLLALPLTGARLAEFGGGWRLAFSVLTEAAVSVAFAPVLMVQQMIAVLRTAGGRRETWAPQRRGATGFGWRVLLRFHAVETVAGAALGAGIAAGVVSVWLSPVAASLALAVALSRFSGISLQGSGVLGTPALFAPAPVMTRAMAAQAALAEMPQTLRIAAE